MLSFPWHNLGIALGATALAEHHQGRTTLWSARVASLYLANHALQYMAASQASRSKAAESVRKFYGMNGSQEGKILLEAEHLWL